MVIGLNSDYAFPLEEGMAIPPVFLPGEYHGQRSLVGYSPWGCTELDTTDAAQHVHKHIECETRIAVWVLMVLSVFGLYSCDQVADWELWLTGYPAP